MIPLWGWSKEYYAARGPAKVADRWPGFRKHVMELKKQVDNDSRIGLAQALADVVYETYEMAQCADIRLDEAIREVHFAHMRTVGPDGKIAYRDDGAVIRPPGWTGTKMSKSLQEGR